MSSGDNRNTERFGKMVERSHTAGGWPNVYGPMKVAGEKNAGWFAPRSDASIKQQGYQITVELPGCTVEDIDIAIQDGAMVIRGEKRFDTTVEGESYFFSEREYGAFQRSFRLPADAEPKGIDASFSNGVLTIAIPKMHSEPGETRKVPIRTA